MIIVIRFKYVILSLVGLVLVIVVLCGQLVTVSSNPDGLVTATLISFLPLRTELLPGRLMINSPDRRQRFEVRAVSDHFKVVWRIREKYFPKGYPLTIRLKNLPTWCFGITRSFQKTCLPRVRPAILGAPPKYSGTRNPLELKFAAPVQAQKIGQWIKTDYPAQLIPRTYRSRRRIFTDYATWMITPTRPLRHATQYRVSIAAQLASWGGIALGRPRVLRFTTVAPLTILKRSPAPGSTGVGLATPVEAVANRQLCQGRVAIPGYSGATSTQGRRLSFAPNRVWLPDTEYQAVVELVDRFGEQVGSVWKFRTQKLDVPVWIEVNLALPEPMVTVYHSKQVVKNIKVLSSSQECAANGAVQRINNRGYAFYARSLHAAAYYWLRTQDGTLIHSVLFGADGQQKPGRLSGCGSIQLALADIKWLYQNLPADTPVIIHGPAPQVRSGPKAPSPGAELIFFNYKTELDQFRKVDPVWPTE